MIIDNFHIIGACIGPPKAEAPLIVDTNAVLAGTPTRQGLKTIARRHSQIIQSGGDFKLPQFSPRRGGDIHETSDADTFRESFGFRALE